MNRTRAAAVTLAACVGMLSGCSGGGSSELTGTVSTLTPRLCVAAPKASGDCFTASRTQLASLHRGDCVLVTSRDGSTGRRITAVRHLTADTTACAPAGPDDSRGLSNCGPGLYLVTDTRPDGSAGSTVGAGGCSGHLDTSRSSQVTAATGSHLVVTIPGGQPFTTWLPRPRTNDPTVLPAIGGDGTHAWFELVRTGRTQLVSTTGYCGSFAGTVPPPPEEYQTCPLLTVVVTAAD